LLPAASSPTISARQPAATVSLGGRALDTFAKGIRGLLDFVVREYGFKPRPAGLINQRDLCTEIRVFLVSNGCDRSQELAPADFYSR
jgi:hypothetical protein